ncbi:LOW QUALITY PROTEIN: Na+phthoate synthase [Geomicrobium sp. JCM 19037]|nr:LOW QUALITY PROTEIN: Na+phthoate synthase [Geomicrobium sp. JCM 19037]
MELEEVIYEKSEGIATITINKPEKYNAFGARTVQELIYSFRDAWDDNRVGVVILTGLGIKHFVQVEIKKIVIAEVMERMAGPAEWDLEMETLHYVMRNIPKPVIAAVNGYAIGGGHVLHVICDLSIASERAIFGQSGPKVGSYDAGFGSAYLARIVGEKKAREIWYLCRKYSADEAYEMGLVNKVVPHEQLMEEARDWANEMLEKSPTALKMLKYSFNADSASIAGINQMALGSLAMFYETDEALEGKNAFIEKRPVDFSQFRSS